MALAATIAWWVSVELLDSQMPFLAPWTALLTVHLTVSRSISRGTQSFFAAALGVALSFFVGYFLGVEVWTYFLALLVGLLMARIPWIRSEGTFVATTAIFVLSSGFDEQQTLLGERIIEVGVGVVIGVAINLLLLPPLRDQQAKWLVDDLNARMGQVLGDMAGEFSSSWETSQARKWTESIESMRQDLADTWSAVEFARESRRGNPRRLLRRRERDSYDNALFRLDEGIAHLHNLTRTLEKASYSDSRWDDRFRERWANTARDTGRRIANPDADVDPIIDRLDQLAENMAEYDELPAANWPVYGALITSLRNLALVVDDAASREYRDQPGA